MLEKVFNGMDRVLGGGDFSIGNSFDYCDYQDDMGLEVIKCGMN